MEVRQKQEEDIRQRVGCDERAFHVVLRLLEDSVSPDYLTDAGQLILPSHYSDVVEERSIGRLCGYPVCANTLGHIPKQRYRISTKTNMVYDITERKKFCSNLCLKASQYFEKQISTSPVWARDKEPRVNFELLNIPAKSCSVGDAVFLTIPQQDIKTELKKLEKQEHSTSSPKSRNLPTEDDADNTVTLESIIDQMSDMEITNPGNVDGITVDFHDQTSGEVTHTGEVNHSSMTNSNQKEAIDESSSSKDTERTNVDTVISTKDSPGLLEDPSKQVETNSPDDERTCLKTTETTTYVTTPAAYSMYSGVGDGGNRYSLKSYDYAVDSSGDVPETRQTEDKDAAVPTISSSGSADKGQQATESKEDYVIRLLNRKKHLLGQLADIQHAEDKQACISKEIDSDEDEEDRENVTKLCSPQKGSEQKPQLPEKSTDQSPLSSKGVLNSGKQTDKLPSPCDKTNNSQTHMKNKESPSKDKLGNEGHTPKTKAKQSPLIYVGSLMQEWITRDSLKYLGVGNAVAPQTEMTSAYSQLFERLNHEERDFDSLLGEESLEGERHMATKPLPDFRKLEEQTKDFELRVKEFFKGAATGKKTGESVQSVALPVVDSHDQMTIRRRIVLDRLHRVIPDLLVPLRLSIQDVAHLVRELVYTCSFTSQNIVFKPGEWTLVGMLIMKLLCLKSRKIEKSFQQASAVQYFTILLTGIHQRLPDLDTMTRALVCLDSDS